jgi:general secretion pathway protein D
MSEQKAFSHFLRPKHLVPALCVALVLAGCASEGGIFDSKSYDLYDKERELTRDDYRNMALPKGVEKEDAKLQQQIVKKAPPIPKVSQILAQPKPPRIGDTKLVSLTVTDDVPLKDVLIELARLADVDIEIGQGVRGGINFRAKDRPFSEVIERVADLAGLRYSMKRGVLRVERDLPYLKNYSVDFLNIVRSSSSDISLSTDVLSSSTGGGGGSSGGGSSGGSGGGGGGGGLTSGTSSSITSQSESDFWVALESSVAEILNYQPRQELAALASEATAEDDEQNDENEGDGGQTAVRGRNGAFFVINRQAGVLTVSASERQHEEVSSYLELLKRNTSAQVLIEAKIVEVELDEGFQSGVDWAGAIGNTNFDIAFPTAITNGTVLSLDSGDNNLGINLDAVVQFVEQFGTSRILSSPRLHAVNNQQAILTFAENRVFFDLSAERQDATSVDGVFVPATVTVDGEAYTVPIGLMLNILPSINMDTDEVTLNVRPTISRQIDTVNNPTIQIIAAQVEMEGGVIPGGAINADVPVLEIRELDSVMKLKSGSVMVIGGLMEDNGRTEQEGLPFLSSVPWVGNAFKNSTKTSSKTELIIFIKATIVGSNGGYHQTDKNVYEKFTDDPRPLSF